MAAEVTRQFAVVTGASSGIGFELAKVFAEDTTILEAQQRNLSAYPDRRLLMLNIDAGGVQSRRVLERWLAQEQVS